MAKMVCFKECFVYNKRFRAGDVFPNAWIKEGYLPNDFFLPDGEAQEMIKELKDHRPIQCAGDDPRSTEQLRAALFKFMKAFPDKWGRKEIWSELRKHEQAVAQTEPPKSKEK